MPIDATSPVPVFMQIADHIRRSVAAGVYKPGDTIPSLRAMALELVVNPNTVQRAYEELEREGVIQSRRGLGMFVTQDGVAGARARSLAAVQAAFTHGARAARAAGMSPEDTRAAFERACSDGQIDTRVQP